MAKVGYARVSTRDQHPEVQVDALTAAGCERVFVDEGVSGRLARRPQLDAALDYLREGDQLVVTRLDRLGRSVRNLCDLSAQLDERGIGLAALHQGIDTTTPGGRMLFHLLAAIAEFERDLIVERVRDGLAAARVRGRKGGRPRVMTPEKATIARQMYDAKTYTIATIAETVGVSPATLYRHLGGGGDARAA